MTNTHRPLVLIILDGWGYRTEQKNNAIAAARKPFWDHLWHTYPHTLLSGSGRCVGLPDGQMGNSEVGHLNMGAGRIVHQDLSRIDMEIETKEFFENQILCAAFSHAKANNKAVHLLGLLSPGGVHSHEKHIHAAVKMAAQFQLANVYLHPILDGRDTPPRSAFSSLQLLENICEQAQCGKIASIIGRYYAMDRDKRWERTKQAYDLYVSGKAARHANDAESALALAYAANEDDEFVSATTIHAKNQKPIQFESGDSVIFMNFRADRARQLTQSLADTHFTEFKRERIVSINFTCLTQYDEKFNLPIAYPSQPLQNTLPILISQHGMKQLRIAETEKYAHVTFFFNGGIEKIYPGEERVLIPSQKVATYDLEPSMSAYQLTQELITRITEKKYDVIICNFANPDMVGHTGNFHATVKAIETIDDCLSKIIPAIQSAGGEAIITADHGNAEQMFDEITQQPHTAHTSDPVPCIYIGRPAKIKQESGKLSDIAPTMLLLLGITPPDEMTGQPIFQL